jgi:hypothetical protein
MRRFATSIAAMVLAAVTQSPGTASATADRSPRDATVRVDQVQVLGTHNSYHVRPPRQLMPNEPADYEHPALDVQLDQGIRSLELDVQNGPTFPVYHSVIVDQASNCPTLEACLATVQRWSDANPGHLPLSIFVELKELPVNANATLQQVIDKFAADNQLTPWDASALDRLDGVVRGVFGRDLITPDELRGKQPTLRAAVTRTGWPTLGKTRGRVMVVFNSDRRRPMYLAGHPTLKGRAMFAIARSDTVAYAAVMSVPVPGPRIRALVREHMFVRTQADADAVEARADDLTRATRAFESGAQVVATDYPVADPTIGPYVVKLPGSAIARCDPVTAPRSCRDRDLEHAATG